MKPHNDADVDLEDGKLLKDRLKTVRSIRTNKISNQALLSGLAYCVSSCSMILVNKFVLSSYGFNAGISLMLYQNFVSVVIVSTLSFFGVVSTEPLIWKLIKVWLPVNVIFVGMLVTSMFRRGELILWRLNSTETGQTWKVQKTLSFHRKDVLDLQWSSDGAFLNSGSVDNSCLIWDANKGSVHQILDSHFHYVQGVAWDQAKRVTQWKGHSSGDTAPGFKSL